MNGGAFRNQRQRHPAGGLRQAGLTLVELMIALVLALLLTLALITVFISGRSSFLTQEQLARLQENGRFAFQFMTTEVQKSGYRPVVWDPPRIGFAFTVNSVDGGGTAPDTLEIQYESDRDCLNQFNTVQEPAELADGSVVNVPSFFHKLIRFTVVNDQLVYRCSWGPVDGTLGVVINDEPVAEGIENLQVQYGEDLTGDLSVNQWVDAGAWNNAFDVVAVRVALLVRTPEEFPVETDNQTFDLYGATSVAGGDRRLRRVYAGEINLRNLSL